MVFFLLERKAGLGAKVEQTCELQINRACRVEMVNKTNMPCCVIKVFIFACGLELELELKGKIV